MIQTRRIADEIQEMIRREAIPPGGRLPTEHTLARRFRVSRPMVREAIQALKALGVVESRPKTGLRVLPFDPTAHFDQIIPRIRTDRDRAEIYELRCLLEPAILRLAAQRVTPEMLDRLEQLLEPPLAKGRDAVRDGLARDVAFHEELWRIAGNRFILGFRGLLLRYFADLEHSPQQRPSGALMRKTNAQHLAIVRALRAGDIDRAQRELTRNLETFHPGRIA
ncbi:MAG: FadR family transcriptional regulator [Planctomycetaceae bacterium]|nr:FadR family transcriptional regulator [Planctomycetaceae bacterium]